MESTFNRYIWKHTNRQQLWIMCVVLVSMVPYYFAFDLPKMLINGPIQGGGFEEAGATQAFLPGLFRTDIQLDRMDTLLGLSIMFLALVIINGLFNTTILYFHTKDPTSNFNKVDLPQTSGRKGLMFYI